MPEASYTEAMNAEAWIALAALLIAVMGGILTAAGAMMVTAVGVAWHISRQMASLDASVKGLTEELHHLRTEVWREINDIKKRIGSHDKHE